MANAEMKLTPTQWFAAKDVLVRAKAERGLSSEDVGRMTNIQSRTIAELLRPGSTRVPSRAMYAQLCMALGRAETLLAPYAEPFGYATIRIDELARLRETAARHETLEARTAELVAAVRALSRIVVGDALGGEAGIVIDALCPWLDAA